MCALFLGNVNITKDAKDGAEAGVAGVESRGAESSAETAEAGNAGRPHVVTDVYLSTLLRNKKRRG